MADNSYTPGTPAWTNALIAAMQDQNAQKNAIITKPLATDTSIVGGNAGQPRFDPSITPGMFADVATQANPPSPGLGSRILDVLMRPLYATAGLANATVSNIKAIIDDNPSEASNPFEALGKGITGQNKTTWSDVLKNAGASETASAIGGLAGDIFLDPANFILGPLGAAAIKTGKGITGATKSAKALENIDAIVKADRAAAELAPAAAPVSLPTKIEEISKPTVFNTPEKSPVVDWGSSGISKPVSKPILELPPGPSFAFEAGAEVTPRPLIGTIMSTGIRKDAIDEALRNARQRAYTFGTEMVPQSPYLGARTAAREVRDPAAQAEFVQKYKHLLTPEDFAALQKTRYPSQWQAKADEIFNRLDSHQFASPEEFVVAAKHGQVPTDEINKVLDAAGIESIDQLPTYYRKLENIVGTNKRRASARKGAATRAANKQRNAEQMSQDIKARIDSLDAEITAIRDKEGLNTLVNDPVATRMAQDDLKSEARTAAFRNIDESTQATRTARIVGEAGKRTRAAGLLGNEQNRVMAASYRKTLAAAEDAEKAAGMRHMIGVNAHNSGYDLSMGDIVNTLSDAQLAKFVLDYGTSIPPSGITAMVARALNPAAGSLAQHTQAILNAGEAHIGSGLKLGRVRTRKKVQDSVMQLTNHLRDPKVQQALRDAATANAVRAHGFDIKLGSKAGDIVSAKALHALSGGNLEDAVDVITNVNKYLDGMLGTNVEAKSIAGQKAAEVIADTTSHADVKAARTVKESVSAYSSAKGPRAEEIAREKVSAKQRAQAKDAADEAREFITQQGIDVPEYAMSAVEVEQGLVRRVQPLKSLAAPWGYSAGIMGDIFKQEFSAFMTGVMGYDRALAQAFKDVPKEGISLAFKQLQSGRLPVDATQKEVYHKLEKELSNLLNTTGKDPLMGALFRGEASIEDISKVLQEEGVPWKFNTRAQKGVSGAIEVPGRAIHADSWRQLDVKDPLEFIARLNGAMLKLNTRMSVAQHFGLKFGALKGGVRNGEMFVTLPKDLKVDTEVMQHIPRKDAAGRTLYYPKSAVDLMINLERILKQPTKFQSRFMNEWFDPILTAWKTGATIIRPGHHIRNMIGDVSLNMMYGVMSPAYYKYAAQVMKADGLLGKEISTDMIRTLLSKPESLAPGALPSDAYKMTVTLKGGKKIEFDAVNSAKLQVQAGILPTFRQTEDFIRAGAEDVKGAAKFTEGLLRSRPLQAAGKAAEFTSHYPRMAQFEYIMRTQGHKFDNLDDLLTYAGKEVKRTHPDTTGLSPEGMKYMRRLMPFYSWIRQIIPFMLETTLTRPTRVTALPKVYHAANQLFNAEGGGNGPLDLFPITRNIPSFIQNTLGYVGGGFTFNLGTPTEAVFGDLLNGNPQRNIASMLNPAIRIPIELNTQTNMSTGSFIADKGEYLDAQVPGLSQLSSISGVSGFGTLANIMTGNGFIDPQRAVQKGEKDYFTNMSLLNFLTGLGIQNFDRPSYEKLAVYEKSHTKNQDTSGPYRQEPSRGGIG